MLVIVVDVAKVAEYILLSVKYTYVIATLVRPHKDYGQLKRLGCSTSAHGQCNSTRLGS